MGNKIKNKIYYEDYKKAFRQIEELKRKENNVYCIHYSCESFFDKQNSSRITCIAIKNLETTETQTFSLHMEAEIAKCDITDETSDKLEKLMLSKFFEFLKYHTDAIYLHWRMRDTTYGFHAIEHRANVLGIQPILVADKQKVDFSLLLKNYCGSEYISHPRLEQLLIMNEIKPLHFLTGYEEAKAFENKDFLALQRSTISKVDSFYGLFEKLKTKNLKTNKKSFDVPIITLKYHVEKITQHWFIALLITIISILGVNCKDLITWISN